MDIGLDSFIRVILTGGHLLHRRRMDHIVHILKCPLKPLFIPHIADKKAQFVRIFLKFILHQKLFELIPGIDDQLFRLIML